MTGDSCEDPTCFKQVTGVAAKNVGLICNHHFYINLKPIATLDL